MHSCTQQVLGFSNRVRLEAGRPPGPRDRNRNRSRRSATYTVSR